MSSDFFAVNPVADVSLVGAVILCLTCFFLWMEFKRKTSFFAVRTLLVIVMMTAAAGLLLRPLYPAPGRERVILLTAGYDDSQADSLVTNHPTWTLMHTPRARAFRNSRALKTRSDLSGKETKFILGQGLPADSLEMYGLTGYRFLPSAHPQGIIRLSMARHIVANRETKIEGTYNNVSGRPVKLTLEGPGGREDSVTVRGSGYHPFRLSLFPKQPGHYLFSMYADNVIQGQVPVLAQKPEPLNILFLQHYPAFETRYLKHFLSSGHRLLIRYQLSRNSYRHEFINLPTQTVGPLTKDVLSAFDVIIIDTDALRALSRAETENVYSAVDGGLGLLPILNTDPSGMSTPGAAAFRKYSSDTAHVTPTGKKRHILPAWPVSVAAGSEVVAVLKNQRRVLSGYTNYGLGKIGFQLLQETYRLVLQGDSTDYSGIWSGLLEGIARSKHSNIEIRARSSFPYFPDRPVNLEVISSGAQPAISADAVALPLKESATIDHLWTATFWSGGPGWRRILSEKDSSALDLYFSHPGEWRPIAISNNLNATHESSTSEALPAPSDQRYTPVALWIFYAMFLTAAAVLWLLPKL